MALTYPGTYWPVYGQGYPVFVAFTKVSDGSLITGWTGAASSISIDGAAAVAGPVPTEIGSSGLGFMEMTPTDMTCGALAWTASVTNSGAGVQKGCVYPLKLVEPTTDWADAIPLTLENLLMNVAAMLINGGSFTPPGTQTVTVNTRAGTKMLTGTVTAGLTDGTTRSNFK